MILLEIDPESISAIEFKGDALRSIDVDRVADWNKPPQGMEIKPGQVHLFRRTSGIQPIEADQDALMQRNIDLGSATFRPKVGERFASECLNHGKL